MNRVFYTARQLKLGHNRLPKSHIPHFEDPGMWVSSECMTVATGSHVQRKEKRQRKRDDGEDHGDVKGKGKEKEKGTHTHQDERERRCCTEKYICTPSAGAEEKETFRKIRKNSSKKGSSKPANIRCEIGWAEMRGRRPEQQDTLSVVQNFRFHVLLLLLHCFRRTS